MAHRPVDPRIAQVIEKMERAPQRVGRVADLAALVNLSESRMAHLFRRGTGVSPTRYLHRLRMERARVLIERTFLSVKEVMACVGVSDPSHFARDFRRHHGVAPTELRRRSWIVAGAPRRQQDWLTSSDPGQRTDRRSPKLVC
jgi:AraC family transcriptional regulator of arabinose operon